MPTARIGSPDGRGMEVDGRPGPVELDEVKTSVEMRVVAPDRRRWIGVAGVVVAVIAVIVVWRLRGSTEPDVPVETPRAATHEPAKVTERPVARGSAAPVEPPADEEIAMAPAHVGRSEPKEPAKKPPPPANGLFSIDSDPYAEIFIDGASFGLTPVLKRSLSAGRHRIRAVLRDGRARDFEVTVPAGGLAQPVRLSW